MTLFYDESQNKYLQKTAEIKTYICDENGNVIRSIGKTELNIAEYANQQDFKLEVIIEGESKKFKEEAKIILHIILERQDDDSKSVNTVSDDELDLKSVQLLTNKGKSRNKDSSRSSKSKDKQSFLFPTTAQSQVTVKSAEDRKIKTSQVSEAVDEKFSQKAQKNRKIRQKSPIRQLQESKKQTRSKINQQQTQISKDDHFFSRLAKKISQISGQRQVSFNKESQKSGKQKQKQSRLKSYKEKQGQNNHYDQDLQTKQGSLQFRVLIANKKVKTLQKENAHLKDESTKLKQVIQQLIEEKSQKQISQTSINSKIEQQLQQSRKTLIEKEMKINELQGLNKLVISREQQKQKENKSLKNQVKQLKMKLEHQKNKLAKVLQTAMQIQNMQLLQIIEKQINDQFY